MLATDSLGNNSFISRNILHALIGTFQTTGFVSVENINTRQVAAELAHEASVSKTPFKHAAKNDDTIKYSANISSPGPKALKFLTSVQLSNTFHDLTGDRYNLTEHMSCITVYTTGDLLSPHIDQPASDCDITCILYLSCKSPAPSSPDTGLRLQVYGMDQQSIRETPVLEIPSVSGRMVIGKGAQVWHGRPPLRDAESVMAVTSCFHLNL